MKSTLFSEYQNNDGEPAEQTTGLLRIKGRKCIQSDFVPHEVLKLKRANLEKHRSQKNDRGGADDWSVTKVAGEYMLRCHGI